MRPSPKLLAFFIFCFAVPFAATLLAFPLWLDAPTRSNPNDPKSAFFHPTPTAVATAPIGTPTATPTVTPTFSLTVTPTFTATPFLLYDGTTVGYRLQDAASAGTSTNNSFGSAGMIETNANGADPGCTNYLQLTCTGAAGTWYAQMNYYTAGGPFNVTGVANALSIWFRVPGPSNGCTTGFRGTVQLLYSGGGGYPYDHSIPVTLTSYLQGTIVTTYDVWEHDIIPFAAFEGTNYNNGTFTASSFQTINGFSILAWYGYVEGNSGGGAIPPSEIDVGQVAFVNVNPATLPSVRNQGKLYDDFEDFETTAWGGFQWQAVQDSITCTSTAPTSFTFPPAHTPPVDNGGNSLSACHAGHISGWVNSDTTCTNYPYAEMNSNFSINGYGNAVDLSNNLFVDFSPNTGAQGMIIRIKHSVANSGQVYYFRLHRLSDDAVGNFDDYKARVADSSLTTSFQAFIMPFPADGSTTSVHPDDGTTYLTFSQSGWGTSLPWKRSDIEQITIMPNNVGMNFDVWVDDIQFY